MVVTVTSLRLKSAWLFFKLSWHGLQISRQAKTKPGFIKMKNTGFGYLHYTCSAWQDEASMKNFAKTGAHLKAMKKSSAMATEIKTYTFETDRMPDWIEAKTLLAEKGKSLLYH